MIQVLHVGLFKQCIMSIYTNLNSDYKENATPSIQTDLYAKGIAYILLRVNSIR